MKDFIEKRTSIVPERPMICFEKVTNALNEIRSKIPFIHLMFVIYIQGQEEEAFYHGVPLECYQELLQKRLNTLRDSSLVAQNVFPFKLSLLPTEITKEITSHLISADTPLSAIDDKSPPHNSICDFMLCIFRQLFFENFHPSYITILNEFFHCQIQYFTEKFSKREKKRIFLCPKHLYNEINSVSKLRRYLSEARKLGNVDKPYLILEEVDPFPKSRKRARDAWYT